MGCYSDGRLWDGKVLSSTTGGKYQARDQKFHAPKLFSYKQTLHVQSFFTEKNTYKIVLVFTCKQNCLYVQKCVCNKFVVRAIIFCTKNKLYMQIFCTCKYFCTCCLLPQMASTNPRSAAKL